MHNIIADEGTLNYILRVFSSFIKMINQRKTKTEKTEHKALLHWGSTVSEKKLNTYTLESQSESAVGTAITKPGRLK